MPNIRCSALLTIATLAFIVTYKDGEKKIVVTPEAAIVHFEPGERSELSQGAKIVATIIERSDGLRDALRINVGRNGITPAI